MTCKTVESNELLVHASEVSRHFTGKIENIAANDASQERTWGSPVCKIIKGKLVSIIF